MGRTVVADSVVNVRENTGLTSTLIHLQTVTGIGAQASLGGQLLHVRYESGKTQVHSPRPLPAGSFSVQTGAR